MEKITELAIEALKALATEKRTAFDALIALEAPTTAQVDEAQALADDLDALAAEETRRETEAAAEATRLAALRAKFSDDQTAAAAEAEGGAEDEDGDEDGDEDEDAEAEAAEGAEGQAATKKVVKAKAKTGSVERLAAKTARPTPPAHANPPITITAQADVPGFSQGSDLDMDKVGQAMLARMRAFGTPSGDGKSENLLQFGVAQFNLTFADDLLQERGVEDQEVLERASKETRLPGDSLVAAGGWCAPSETIYDLCTTETTEGILSLPEVGVKRGGIKFTSGPDFAAVYAAASGFDLTEAQVIAGTAKTCFEVPCPSFTDVRLDAVGICIKAPLLTNAAYPELVRRWIEGTLIAHQHRINAKMITAMATAAGAARVYDATAGTTAGATLDALELVAETLREKYRMGQKATMEVVVPNWALGAIRADLSKRTGQEAPVTDQQIAAHFTARHLKVSYVYDWQMLATPDTLIAYPATFQALLYPAGTFVKGTADVITLNAVYDSASLAANIYTALFAEQGVLLAKMCNQAALVTLPVCNAGRTGAANLTCA